MAQVNHYMSACLLDPGRAIALLTSDSDVANEAIVCGLEVYRDIADVSTTAALKFPK